MEELKIIGIVYAVIGLLTSISTNAYFYLQGQYSGQTLGEIILCFFLFLFFWPLVWWCGVIELLNIEL